MWFFILLWYTTLTKCILLIMYSLKLTGLRSKDCLLVCFFDLPLNSLYFIFPCLFVNSYVFSFPFSPCCFSLTVAVLSIATGLQRTFRKWQLSKAMQFFICKTNPFSYPLPVKIFHIPFCWYSQFFLNFLEVLEAFLRHQINL